LWLREQAGLPSLPIPQSDAQACGKVGVDPFDPARLVRGDIVFLSASEGRRRHVMVYLGWNQYLNILGGCESRIENGLTLMRRLKFEPYGQLPPKDAERVCAALADPVLGDPVDVVLIVLALLAMGLSYALQPSLAGFKNRNGRYSQDQLVTQKNPEIPLPDLLGSVVVAGNSVYQQLPDRGATATASAQKLNQVIVLCSSPAELIDYKLGLQIKGMSWEDKFWKDGSSFDGIYINPDQTKDDAVSGNILDDTAVPSISLYDGAHAISVPVDIRAQYDRTFPVYGFSGCSYLVFRMMDSTKFSAFNVTCRTKGRRCRTFDTSGFVRATATAESLAGADGAKVRFKLAHDDIEAVSSLTVGVTAYSQISSAAQTGNVYQLNKTKGFVEFITAPANASTITITYTYFVRAWTRNPGSHAVYLLTEPSRGKGFDESRLDWASAVDLRDYCDASITFNSTNGFTTGPRYVCNYALDDRKPIQDHLRAILDSCNALCFFSGGKFVFKARTGTESSVFSFSPSNILLDQNEQGQESSFEATLVDRTSKLNRVKLLYHSDQALQAETEVIVDDEDNQRARAPRVGNNGIVDDNLKFPSVTTQDQAERLGYMLVQEQVSSNWQYKWTTNIRGLALQPGDIVDVTHPSLFPVGARVLRIETLEYDESDHLQITASEYVPSAYI